MISLSRASACALVLSVAATLSSCGGSDPETKESASPSPSASSSSASPTPTPTGPPKQPKGEFGTTFKISNWQKYGEDAPVLALKRFFELYTGSITKQATIPEMLRILRDTEFRRTAVGIVDLSRENNLHARTVMRARIQSSRTAGRTATVRACVWNRDQELVTKDNTAFRGGMDPGWGRNEVRLRQVGKRWVITKISFPESKCPGRPPR